jgi:hypothetical protein
VEAGRSTGGAWVVRLLDSTNPDLSAFKRGGKLMVVIGTNDTLASPGAQVAYYQSVVDDGSGRRRFVRPLSFCPRRGVLNGWSHGWLATARAASPGPNTCGGLLTAGLKKGSRLASSR